MSMPAATPESSQHGSKLQRRARQSPNINNRSWTLKLPTTEHPCSVIAELHSFSKVSRITAHPQPQNTSTSFSPKRASVGHLQSRRHFRAFPSSPSEGFVQLGLVCTPRFTVMRASMCFTGAQWFLAMGFKALSCTHALSMVSSGHQSLQATS